MVLFCGFYIMTSLYIDIATRFNGYTLPYGNSDKWYEFIKGVYIPLFVYADMGIDTNPEKFMRTIVSNLISGNTKHLVHEVNVNLLVDGGRNDNMDKLIYSIFQGHTISYGYGAEFPPIDEILNNGVWYGSEQGKLVDRRKEFIFVKEITEITTGMYNCKLFITIRQIQEHELDTDDIIAHKKEAPIDINDHFGLPSDFKVKDSDSAESRKIKEMYGGFLKKLAEDGYAKPAEIKKDETKQTSIPTFNLGKFMQNQNTYARYTIQPNQNETGKKTAHVYQTKPYETEQKKSKNSDNEDSTSDKSDGDSDSGPFELFG